MKAILLLVLLLAACASGPEYCVVERDGKSVFLFQGSRDQTLAFERNGDAGAQFKPRDWTQPAAAPWRR